MIPSDQPAPATQPAAPARLVSAAAQQSAATHPSGTAQPAQLVSARRTTALMFGGNGFLFACWVPHIPEVKHNLHLSDPALGLALLGPAVGGLLALFVVGRATARLGSGRLMTLLALATYLVAPASGLALNLPTLFLALALWGATAGGLDVAMNAQAVHIEARYRRPIMSSFHGFWSLGTVVGTLVGGVGAGAGVPLAAQQAVLATLLAVITVLVRDRQLPDPPAATMPRGQRVIDVRLVLLGIAGLCALLAEGSSADWSPVYLRDDLGVSAGRAGIAFTAFTIMMMTGRAVGDRLVLRWGRTRSLVGCGLLGTIGMGFGLIGGSLVTACIGFGCLGFGLSVMVPVFISAAAEGPGTPAPRLAIVASFSYFGFLIGPAALGPLAGATSVHTALWALPAFTALAVVLGVIAFGIRSTGHRRSASSG